MVIDYFYHVFICISIYAQLCPSTAGIQRGLYN